ncbi:hypothetical protein GCM10019016_110530 [Streptomyces prasinosporus]|uniref:Alanine dehydrogenase/pyridine nucleotide transhydrogenase NAD(H)-binding domain-containing protein n=1 Tax=Streptomyces prasinosporus TaxID=68256 RepID=A0ABP6U9R2_9ACTN
MPNTSTYALTNATLPYIVELANRGWVEALRRDPALAKGLNTHDGKVVYKEVAEAHGPRARGARLPARLSPSARRQVDQVTDSQRRYVNTDRQRRIPGRTLPDKVRPGVCMVTWRFPRNSPRTRLFRRFAHPVKPAVRRPYALDRGAFRCRHIEPGPVDCVAANGRHAIESPIVGMVPR